MKLTVRSIILIVCLVSNLTGMAQSGFGNEEFGNDEPYEDDFAYPVDGGASILIAAGIAYGIKRVRDVNKKKLDDPNDNI